MLESFPIAILIGVALGFLAGLGVGGGSLLIIWLTLVLNIDYPLARSINLLFFIPCAVISTIFRWKKGNLKLSKVFPAIISGCVSAAIFSVISKNMDVSLLKKFFGLLLLIIGFRELLYKPRNKH